jgi:PKD repeat protein
MLDSMRSSGRGRSIAICAIAACEIFALSISTATAAPWARGEQPRGPYSSGQYAPRGAHLPFGGSQQAVCGQAAPGGGGQCLIHVLQPGGAAPAAQFGATEVKTPYGLSPETIKKVYGYSTSLEAGAGQTIALVDAYNDPNAASDLATFSNEYGLPAANFTQVNQTGGSSLPATNSGWDLEISLDIEWAHALAPAAHVLLVEASSNSLSNLLAAEQYAAKHANYVSNSWGSSEFSGETADDSYFKAAGVSYFAAAGDEGSEMLWPSASPDVTSVGGTSLTLTAAGTLAQEEAWSGGGGGCSRYETANPDQLPLLGSVSCAGRRATPDISLDANPNSGVSVYDSVAYERQSGWWTVGGTSASTAMTAANSAVSGAEVNAERVYASPAVIPFRDIILGSNGHPALTSFDLATGLGSWSDTPGPATGLTATRNGSDATLSWSAPSGIAPVTGYNIWQGTASGAETTDIATVTASAATTYTATIEGLTAGDTYYYEIQPVNILGVGPFSNQAVAAGPSVAPVASFSTSCSGATCSFKSTSTDESGTISAFVWNGGNGRTGSASTFSDTYSSATSYTVTLTVTNTAGQSSKPPASEVVKCSLSSSGGRRNRSTLTCT